MPRRAQVCCSSSFTSPVPVWPCDACVASPWVLECLVAATLAPSGLALCALPLFPPLSAPAVLSPPKPFPDVTLFPPLFCPLVSFSPPKSFPLVTVLPHLASYVTQHLMWSQSFSSGDLFKAMKYPLIFFIPSLLFYYTASSFYFPVSFFIVLLSFFQSCSPILLVSFLFYYPASLFFCFLLYCASFSLVFPLFSFLPYSPDFHFQ